MQIKLRGRTKGRLDWPFLAAAGGLIAIGTVAVMSAASPLPSYPQILRHHFAAMGMGVVFFIFGLSFNYQIFQDQAKSVYAGLIVMLVAVLVFGSIHRGHRAWLNLGVFVFQPSELARVGMILVVAAYLDYRMRWISRFSTVGWALAITAPLIVLILKQPDFSTALTFFPILAGLLFCAGAEIPHLIALIGFAAVAFAVPLACTVCQIYFPDPARYSLPYWLGRLPQSPFLILAAAVLAAGAIFLIFRASQFFRFQAAAAAFVAAWIIFTAGLIGGALINRELKGYQRDRFVAYFAPKSDIQGASYHVHQSQIAIGSGGFMGKGLFSGTQSQLGFLPERHTDFIYAVIGEEMGFWGTVSVLALYLLLIWRIVLTAGLARDFYGYLVCCGMACFFAFQILLNAGMCLGLIPVAGVPLPLVSYGGSSLAITMWGLGIVSNIYSQRYSLS